MLDLHFMFDLGIVLLVNGGAWVGLARQTQGTLSGLAGGLVTMRRHRELDPKLIIILDIVLEQHLAHAVPGGGVEDHVGAALEAVRLHDGLRVGDARQPQLELLRAAHAPGR